MVRRAKTELLLRAFEWPVLMRECGSDANSHPAEYVDYIDEDGKRRSFTVRKEDGRDISDVYYVKTNLVTGGAGNFLSPYICTNGTPCMKGRRLLFH